MIKLPLRDTRHRFDLFAKKHGEKEVTPITPLPVPHLVAAGSEAKGNAWSDKKKRGLLAARPPRFFYISQGQREC